MTPAVATSAVVSTPDSKWGERVIAYYVARGAAAGAAGSTRVAGSTTGAGGVTGTDLIAKAADGKASCSSPDPPRAVLARLSDKGPSALPRIGCMDDSLREDQAARSHRPSRR